MRNHIIEIPVRIRSMAIPTDKATPMESPFRMDFEVMEPLETSSTCLVSYVYRRLSLYNKEAHQHTDRNQQEAAAALANGSSQILTGRHEADIDTCQKYDET